MLTELLPQAHPAYLSLPLLGRILDAFDDWLIERGYRRLTRQCYIIRCKAIDSYFRRRRFHNLEDLTRERFRHCQRFLRKHSGITGTVGCLERFLRSKGKIPAPIASPATPFDPILASYQHYMVEVRGLASSSVDLHSVTVGEFLRYLYRGRRTFRLADLTPEHVDRFIRSVAVRYSRHTLSHAVASIQAFLRFLKLHDHVPSSREFVVYRPRLYKNEKLPRVLPWETVRTFLDGIDRDTFAGLRDYAMFLLIATYGLRRCDVAGLRLDDIDWRTGVLDIRQRKTGSLLRLPLTRAVADALLAYLRTDRPRCSNREIFFTAVAPIVPLQPPMVSYAFRQRVRVSGLDIPFEGVHCLRHSYAAHLQRRGISLKTIGDLLGHASIEATSAYIRVNIDDLREVALPLPAAVTGRVQP
jgi:integrase/recombinase XerD